MSDQKKKVSDVTKKVRYGQLQTTIKNKTIVNISEYTTNGEYLLVVKDIDNCTIYLNGETTDSIKIKALNNTRILPINSTIDGQYEEIEINNGACVELEYCLGGWYIISSDGIKQ